MKKLLLIVSIISMIAGVLSLLLSAWKLYGYYHVLDGSADLFSRLQQQMRLYLVIGIILAGIGAVCMIVSRKM